MLTRYLLLFKALLIIRITTTQLHFDYTTATSTTAQYSTVPFCTALLIIRTALLIIRTALLIIRITTAQIHFDYTTATPTTTQYCTVLHSIADNTHSIADNNRSFLRSRTAVCSGRVISVSTLLVTQYSTN
jgi:hypothetical protein